MTNGSTKLTLFHPHAPLILSTGESMPRPPKPITAENFAPLHRQLARLLADQGKAAKALRGAPELAMAAFGAVNGSPTLLDEWVTLWLTQPAKVRMWASLRQKAYKKKRKARVLMVSDEAYTALSDTAKRHKLTLSGAILFLTKGKKGGVMDLWGKLAEVAWSEDIDIIVEFSNTSLPRYQGPAQFGNAGNDGYCIITTSSMLATECSKLFGNVYPAPAPIKVLISVNNETVEGFVQGSNTQFGRPTPVPIVAICLKKLLP